MEPLISVIIPVYQVEEYLDRCVESVINQTYQNLEIILVDDGSPDNCPQLCDNWRNKDSRITVIHQKNSGGGQARNRALDIAQGEYITFVDSDDYIAPWMYEFLYSLFYDDIDIVECGFYTVYDDNAQFDDLADPFEIEEFTAEKAVMENIRDQIFRQLIWNKMYRRRTIGDIRFPIGSKIDDEFWTYQVLGNARKLLHTNKRLYAYRQQKNSIMHSLNSQERIQAVEAKIQRHKYICIKLPELKGESLYNLWFTCLYQGQLALKSSNVYEKKSIVIFLKKTLRTYRIDLAELKEISITHKLWIVLEKIWFVGACKLRNLLKCGI